MKDSEFYRLMEPLNILVGYCRSAADITPESDTKKWAKILMQLAKNLEIAWDEVAKAPESNDEKTE